MFIGLDRIMIQLFKNNKRREVSEIMATIESTTNKNVLTAAEKRAARRAKVLQRGEDILNLLSNQLHSNQSIKKKDVDQLLNDSAEELLQEENSTTKTTTLNEDNKDILTTTESINTTQEDI